MKLREDEQILRVYHHHPTPFVFNILKVLCLAVPVYFFVFALADALSRKAYFFLHLGFFVLFLAIVAYLSLIYWLDKLIVTSQRMIHIDWQYLSIRHESDLELKHIQDVLTNENGWLSHFKIFDYGKLFVDTASSSTAIEFDNAPNPEEMRRYIYHVKQQ